MTSNQILVPAHVAQREAIERANREAEERKRAHGAVIEALKLKLKSVCDDAETYRQAIQKMCGALLNHDRLISTQLTAAECGRLISDVLLGDGVEYEIKT